VRRSSATAEPKFRREPPEARREELVAATLECLAKYGHEGVSVRKISAVAGVSMGLINHHFPGIDGLVAAAYDSLATRLLQASREHALTSDGDPAGRLHAYFVASFAPEALKPELFRIWLVFWSLVPHSPAMRAVHDRTYGETREVLEGLLSLLKRVPGVPPFRVPLAALGLNALMDGLWVELSLSRSNFLAEEAISLCDDWVHGLASGAFLDLRSSKRS
jgi:AcrR family transcriptional regulator